MVDTTTGEFTRDAIADGAIELLQREDGYRFGLDAVLLATDLPALGPEPSIADLGAAHGPVALCIASRRSDAEVLALERQPPLVDLLEHNVAINDLADRVRTVRGDVRNHEEQLPPHEFDLVVSNPPYYPEGDRRPSPNRERAAARHELEGTLTDFVRAAAYTLDQRGYLKTIVPPLRLGDLVRAAEPTDLSFDSLRFFHSRPDEDAYLVEALLRRGGAADARIRPPLIVYDGDQYADEVRSRIDGAARTGDGA
ncbi:MAG: tRNA1(Val) (adenine(37)-N6)-methyltransferase [Bradymonadaceae bacterium]